jgi:hypothetical protein
MRIIAIAEKFSMNHMVRACIAVRSAAAGWEARYKNRGVSNKIVTKKNFARFDRDLSPRKVRCGLYRTVCASALEGSAIATQIFLWERVANRIVPTARVGSRDAVSHQATR